MNLPKLTGYFYQLVAALLGNLLSFSYGITFGMTSSALVEYQSDDTPLMRKISEDEASWITSYLCLGGILGSFVFGFVADKYGRRSTLLLTGLLHLFGWFCIVFGYRIEHIFASRILIGTGSGGSFLVLPLYISEISENKWRGSLGSYVSTMRNLGVVVGFIVAAFVAYDITPFIGLGISVIFVMSFPFVQESPYYLLKQNNQDMLEKCLRYFRGIRSIEERTKPEFLAEVDKFRILSQNYNTEQGKTTCADYCSCPTLKIYIISLVLITTTQFCGVFAILNYANTIFTNINTALTPNVSGIILAIMQFVGAYISTLIADRINRKILIAISSMVTAISLIGFGVFLYLSETQLELTKNFEWIPLVCLSCAIIFANIGLYPLGYVVFSEICPPKIKNCLSSFGFAYSWLLALISVKFYYILVEICGIYGCMWIFAGFCLFECVFVLIFLPETRGKSLEDIQAYFYKIK